MIISVSWYVTTSCLNTESSCVNWCSPGTRIYQSQLIIEISCRSCNWVSCLEHPHQPTFTTRGCDICSSGKSEEYNFKCDGFKSNGIFFLLILYTNFNEHIKSTTTASFNCGSKSNQGVFRFRFESVVAGWKAWMLPLCYMKPHSPGLALDNNVAQTRNKNYSIL